MSCLFSLREQCPTSTTFFLTDFTLHWPSFLFIVFFLILLHSFSCPTLYIFSSCFLQMRLKIKNSTVPQILSYMFWFSPNTIASPARWSEGSHSMVLTPSLRWLHGATWGAHLLGSVLHAVLVALNSLWNEWLTEWMSEWMSELIWVSEWKPVWIN